MGLLDKARAAAEQAAQKAKEGVEDVQTKRELGQAYDDLGKAAFGLIESGVITHPSLEAAATRIRGLQAKLAEDGAAEQPDTDADGSSDPPPAT